MPDANPNPSSNAQQTLAYGSWSSPITSQRIAGGTLRLSQPQLDAGTVYWLEGRPAEGGRQVVMSQARGSAPQERTPGDVNVRTRVHEYGGGDYRAVRGRLFYVDFATQVLWCQAPDGSARPLSLPGPRFADFDVSPDDRWLVAVEEAAQEAGEPENRIVAFDLSKRVPQAPQEVASGHDFFAAPRFSPDGRKLAYLAWDHPNMPWDGTQLMQVPWSGSGPASAGSARAVAGGPHESIVQPSFSPGGLLTFVSDRSGWWNLYQLRGDSVSALCPRSEEFATPPWVFAMSSYAFVSEGRVLCRVGNAAGDRLASLDIESGDLEDTSLPFSAIGGLAVERGQACLWGASAREATGIYRLALEGGELERVCSGHPEGLGSELFAVAEALELPSSDGRTTHAYFYRPKNPAARGPAGARPPLLVKSHGGPTAATSPALDLAIQYWTSRGIAVVDVNYGGSTGYGRAYRERLRGRWGIVDVEDCVAAAQALAAEGRVDGQRLAITGGSAGGYTTLCALTFTDVFAAGASHYGIGDLEALARDTHKFESRYLDGLIGPYPEARALYVERSPIHSADRLSCPVIFFQGLEDEVVPPNQAQAMVSALAARGIPHAYVPFEGEQHGFRRAENVCTALDGELYFYSRVFGFDVERHPPEVAIRNL